MFGPRVAALRRDAGLSQAELARELGISPSAMGMYEQGRREPSMETVVALAGFFGVTTDYLLTGKPSEQEAEKLRELLLHRIDRAARRLEERRDIPFTRQELAVLFAALLLEP